MLTHDEFARAWGLSSSHPTRGSQGGSDPLSDPLVIPSFEVY
jgi:hypothetical protein